MGQTHTIKINQCYRKNNAAILPALKDYSLITPLDKLLDPMLERRRRFIVEELTSFSDVRPCLRHVARLLRQAIYDCLLADDFLDCLNHLAEGNRLIVAKIDDFVVGACVVERTNDAFDDGGQKGSNAKSKDMHCVPLRGKACGWVEWLVLGGS